MKEGKPVRRTKTREVTAQRLREVLTYDPVVGRLTWLPRPGCARSDRSGLRAGTVRKDGYRGVSVDRVNLLEHLAIWCLVTGRWPRHEIDHRNRIRDDNRWCNLREATPKQNKENSTLRRDNKLGVKGVAKDRNQFVAYIYHHKKRLILGRFSCLADAAEARRQGESRLFTHSTHHGS